MKLLDLFVKFCRNFIPVYYYKYAFLRVGEEYDSDRQYRQEP